MHARHAGLGGVPAGRTAGGPRAQQLAPIYRGSTARQAAGPKVFATAAQGEDPFHVVAGRAVGGGCGATKRARSIQALCSAILVVDMHTQVTVVYADILGFTQLVISHNSLIELLDGFSHSESSVEQLRNRLVEDHEDRLTHTFAVFHRTLDLQLNELLNVDPLQSIVFSDSAFVAFRDNNTALYFAEGWMRTLLSFKVPVRMGIGTGSFRALRLTTDVSDDVRRHSSQFLGTAVIQAHQAESCGLKGMRVFIHPAAVVTGDWNGHFCDVHEDTSSCTTKVVRELNYFRYVPEFILSSNDQKSAESDREALVQTVTTMMHDAPVREREHYKATLRSLALMRAAFASGQRS